MNIITNGATPSRYISFAGYTLCGRDLESISIPTTIITSKDDPIIPVEDFYHLSVNRHLQLIIHPYGGHNGFISSWCGRTWYEGYLKELIVKFAPS